MLVMFESNMDVWVPTSSGFALMNPAAASYALLNVSVAVFDAL